MSESITMIGTLPPIKGVSDYCIEQTKGLAKSIYVLFINFSSIYPESLYKGGGTKESDPVFKVQKNSNLEVRDILYWWNPLSWVYAGLTARGKILHFHWWTFYLFPVFFTACAVAKFRGKKIICTIHNVLGHESGFFDRLFSGIMFALPNKFIVHTRMNKEQLVNYFRVPAERIEVVPHGIYNFYRDREIPMGKARKKLGIPQNSKVLLFFGNIRKYKGVEDLIEAFKKAREEIPGLFLIVAGKPWDDGLGRSLLECLSKIKEKKVVLGYIPSSEIKFYFSASDLVVLPYRDFAAQSGPGNIALAFEKPLLVSDSGGLPELVLNREMIFESGNPAQLSQKIILVFRKNLLPHLSKDSSVLRKEYSWENISRRTLEIYNNSKLL